MNLADLIARNAAFTPEKPAIRFLGASPIHRTSWRRVRELMAGGAVAEVVEIDEFADPAPAPAG